MKYILSPEFHRQLWLRFSPFRLIAAPLVMALIVTTTHNVPHGNAMGGFQMDMSVTLYAAMAVFYVTVILWGTYEAATAMQEEIRGNTWDYQRMSSIKPAQLALGKLFGATSYAWYFGLLALAVFGVSYLTYRVPDSFYGSPDVLRQSPFPEPPDDTLYVMFCMLASGLVAQLIAFLYSFADTSGMLARGGRLKVPRGIGAFLLGAAAGTHLFSLTVTREANNLRPRSELMLHHVDIYWYGFDFWRANFVVVSFIFFIGWFIVGACRLAREELQYRNLPWVWVLFIASAVGWYNGFVFRFSALAGGNYNYFQTLLVAFIEVMSVCYLTMFLEAYDSRRYARLSFHARRREWLRAFENVPKWLATVPLALVLMAALIANAPPAGAAYFDTAHVIAFTIALSLFMIRDGCVLHAIQLTQRGRGAAFTVLFYYLLAYGLLPMVSFSFVNLGMNEVMHAVENFRVPAKVTHLAALFFPIPLLDPGVSVFPPLVETLVAAAWLYNRITARPTGVIENKA